MVMALPGQGWILREVLKTFFSGLLFLEPAVMDHDGSYANNDVQAV